MYRSRIVKVHGQKPSTILSFVIKVTIKLIIILSLFLFMFVMKMVFIRDQFKVEPRPDWSLLGPVSSKFYDAPSCDLTKSLLVMLGLLEIVSFGFVKLPTRLVIPRKHP